MREDLTRFGVEETRTPEAVDQVLAPGNGTVLMVVNSVCGCAATQCTPRERNSRSVAGRLVDSTTGS